MRLITMYTVEKVTIDGSILIGSTTHAAVVKSIIENHFKMAIDNLKKVESIGYRVIRTYQLNATTKIIIKKYSDNLVGSASI